jgi:hypothetical protein
MFRPLIKVAFKCTQKEFEQSFVDGIPLKKALRSMGYEIENHPLTDTNTYLANFYKKSTNIGATSTPYNSGRRVFDHWNAKAFLACCSQQEGTMIRKGEYFVHNNNLYQCEQVDGKYLRYKNSTDSGTTALLADNCEKATYDDIISKMDMPEVELAESVIIGSVALETIHNMAMQSNPVNHQTFRLNGSNHSETAVESPSGHSMAFLDICQALRDGKEVFIGKLTDAEILCYGTTIKCLMKDSVETEKGTHLFTSVFATRAAFIAYCAKKIND